MRSGAAGVGVGGAEVLEAFESIEELAALGGEERPRSVSRTPSSAALEQGGAEVAFGLLDLRHGRRRVELIGRCDDGARPRDCRECARPCRSIMKPGYAIR